MPVLVGAVGQAVSIRANHHRVEHDRHQRLNAHAHRAKEKTIEALPLGIRCLPQFVQWAYLTSFNDNLMRFGDAALAQKAAEKAARNAISITEERKVNARPPKQQFDYDRLKPPRGATILVPA